MLLFLMFYTVVYSQEVVETVFLENDQGLAERIVERVIRDDNGYFFLFTKDHIQRYDGKHFEIVDVTAITDKRLNILSVRRIGKDSNGSIILGGELDHNYIIPKGGLRVLPYDINGKVMCSDQYIFVARQTGDNWSIYDPDGAVVLKDMPFEPEGLSIHNNTKLVKDRSGAVYKRESNDWKKLCNEGLLTKGADFISLWDSTSVRIFKNNIEVNKIHLLDDGLKPSISKRDAAGNIIASYSARPRYQDRIFRLNPSLEVESMDSLLNVSNIYKDFHTDNSDYKWMLVGYNGMQIVNLNRSGSTFIMRGKNLGKSRFGHVVSAVASDNKGNTYFLKERGPLFKVDHDNPDDPIMVYSQEVWDKYLYQNTKFVYSESEDCFYSYAYRYGGKMSMLFRLYPERKKITPTEIPIKMSDILPEGGGKVIVTGWLPDGEKRIGQIGRYDFNTGVYKTLKNDLPNVRTIAKSYGKYWVGTKEGLYVVDQEFNTINVFDINQTIESGKQLQVSHIMSVSAFDKHIVVGTYGKGVYVLDAESEHIIAHVTTEDGLCNNDVVGCLKDDEGNLWAYTFKGISVINNDFKVIKSIYDHQGLTSREFNAEAVAKDVDGNFYGGTINGVQKINPKEVLNWKENYGVDILNAFAYNDGTQTLIEDGDDLQVFAGVDSIILETRLPDYFQFPFTNNELNVSTDLDHVVKGSNLVLKNIGLGDHTISLHKGDGKVSEEINLVSKINFSLWLKRVLFFALFGALLYSAIMYVRRQEKQKTEVNKRISELQLQSLQAQMNPHFIFNALGAIQYFIQTHDAEKADEYLSDFAMLMRGILDSSKSKYITLRKEINLLQLYVRLEAIRFEGDFEYTFDIDPELDLEMNIPPMIIQPFIENAVNHGLFNLKDRKGQLTIKMEEVSDEVINVIIEDNGIGRELAAQKRTKKHKSRGMQIIKDKIETINKSEGINMTTKIDDLKNASGEGIGTRVTIEIRENYD